MIKKKEFIEIIDEYYSTMKYYQLVKLYFKIIDKNNPYYYKKSYCQKVFDKVHSNHCTYHSCCSLHQNNIYLKKYMKNKLSTTQYEKKIYKRACEFFYKLNLQVLRKYQVKVSNDNILKDWNFIHKYFKIKRSGKLFYFYNNYSKNYTL